MNLLWVNQSELVNNGYLNKSSGHINSNMQLMGPRLKKKI